MRARCQPGSSLLAEVGRRWAGCPARRWRRGCAGRRRGASPTRPAAARTGCRWRRCRGARPTLSASLVEGLVGAAARVLVVPARRVERTAREVLHARDGRQLHEVEDPDGQDVPAAADFVAAIGVDEPAALVLLPLGAGHAGVEQRVVLEAVALGDPLEVAADLLARGVAPGGDVVELLEHRDVHVRLDVAHDAGVAVPVPGAADAARLVDDADPLDARLAQVGRRRGRRRSRRRRSRHRPRR